MTNFSFDVILTDITVAKTTKNKSGNRFGAEFRRIRESKDIGLRKLSRETGMQIAYIARIEKGKVAPSDKFICEVARVLNENPEVLASKAGMITSRLERAISKNPKAFSDLIFQLENAPENVILRVIREVRDGEW